MTESEPDFDGIDALLASARARYARITAEDAYAEVRDGRAVLVDTRPQAQRDAEGEVSEELKPILVERNVLEWRFDPRQQASLPEASFDARVIVMCQEGYSSSLAADALRSIGIGQATDVIGGFGAWRQAGLPVA
ncbi:rhodanese-like domain-containing protein [Demetria terragena]|uniref:rhodanese-like domain-containing protein n=1 Tax=Demetria terragena TaxID=63959 RepID=UPI00036AA37C|nr:rhodanese-like domain-containing protein [Demetria terragena]